MNSLKPIMVNLSIPFFISLVFGLVLLNEAKIPTFIFKMTPYLFYFLSGLLLWVSWHFNRNRFIFIIIPLVLIHLGFDFFSPKQATSLYLYVSILYPVHLLLFLLLKERGLFSIWGLFKIGFFLLEISFILYLVYYPNAEMLTLLKSKIFTFSSYPFKDIAVVIGIFVLFLMTLLILFNRFLIYNSSFLMMTFSFYMGLYFLKTPYASDISFLTINVIIFALLIRESYRLAFYDELTDLPGRRSLVEDMAKLGRRYSLAMIDIDHFKKFNDSYGHETGDDVLKMVATKLAAVSGGGKAYRYGGEEFVILFSSSGVDEAFTHTDVLRDVVATTAFSVRNEKSFKKIYVNISAGVVQNTSKDKDPFAVMKRADNALYKAKKAGRNRVIKEK